MRLLYSLLCIVCLFSVDTSYAQDFSTGTQTCNINNHQIITQSIQKVGTEYQAQLIQWPDAQSSGSYATGNKISRSLNSPEGIIARGTGHLATLRPQRAGNYQLRYIINTDSCEINVSTNINVYEYLFAVIADSNSIGSSIQQHPQIGLIVYTPPEWNRINTTASGSHHLFDGLLIQMNNVVQAFEIIQNYSIAPTKKVIIGSNLDPRLLKRFVAQQSQKLSGTTIFVMNTDQFATALLRLSLGQYDIMTGTVLYPSLAQDDVTGGQLLDQLLLYGFPLELLAFALVSCVVIMLLVIIKHVIGFSIYQLAYPLMIGQIMTILGWGSTAVIAGATFISCRVVSIGLRRLPVLYSTKIGLVMIGSLLRAGAIILLMQYLMPAYRSYDHLHQPLTIVSIGIVSRAVYRLFYDKIGRSGWIGDVTRCAVICIIVWRMYSSDVLQSWLLRFPVLIVGAIVITILAGRYRGLQIREYLRFWPLIKHQLFKDHTKS